MSNTKIHQKHAEEERRISAPEFQALIEGSPNLIATFDKDGRYRYVNAAFEKAVGAGKDGILGRTVAEIGMDPDYAALVERTVRKVFASGREESAETCIGDRFYQTGFVPRPGPDGSVETVISYASDITESKRSRENLARSYDKLHSMAIGVIAMISRVVEMRDQYTAGHQRHVSQLACAIAKEMGLPGGRTEGIRIAGLVHDIGKLSVPVEILNKMGRLTPVEVSIIRIHPASGYEILKDIDFPWPVAEVAHQHQERLDGSGYPRGLAGDGILLESRIVSVADVVEAMTFSRPYREPIGLEKALDQVRRGRAILYYPPAVDACLKLFRENLFHFDR